MHRSLRSSLLLNGCLLLGACFPTDAEKAAEYNKKGNALFAAGAYEEATMWYAKSIEIATDAEGVIHFYALYGNRGKAWLRAGHLKEALADFDQALRLEPTPEDAAIYHRHQGDIYRRLGHRARAVQSYTASIEALGSDTAYAARCTLLAEQSQKAQAIEACIQAVRAEAEIPQELRRQLGEVCRDLSRSSFASGDYQEALKQHLDASLLWPELGSSRQAMIRLADIHRALAHEERDKGNIADANNHLNELQALGEESIGRTTLAEERYRLGSAASSRGDLDDAGEQFVEAYRLAPQQRYAQAAFENFLKHGAESEAQGSYREAVAAYEDAARWTSGDATPIRERIDILAPAAACERKEDEGDQISRGIDWTNIEWADRLLEKKVKKRRIDTWDSLLLNRSMDTLEDSLERLGKADAAYATAEVCPEIAARVWRKRSELAGRWEKATYLRKLLEMVKRL